MPDSLKSQVKEATLENGRVPLTFRPGYGMTAWNGGASNIYFDANQTYNEVPVETAEALPARYPKNFFIGEAEKPVSAVPVEAVEEKAEEGEQDLPPVTHVDLVDVPFNRLRKMAAELAEEGDTVPRKKVEVIDFIVEKQG